MSGRISGGRTLQSGRTQGVRLSPVSPPAPLVPTSHVASDKSLSLVVSTLLVHSGDVVRDTVSYTAGISFWLLLQQDVREQVSQMDQPLS